jgi:hypothetical protein
MINKIKRFFSNPDIAFGFLLGCLFSIIVNLILMLVIK